MDQEASYLIIGRIVRTQGLTGAVRIELAFEDDRLLQPKRHLILAGRSGEQDVEIEFFRRQHGRYVLKLREIDSISAAEKVIGAELRIDRNDVPPPVEGAFYTFQLKGCQVFSNSDYLGTVTDVLDVGGSEILKVDLADEEILIPFAQSYLLKIDLIARRIEVELPEGLRELNR